VACPLPPLFIVIAILKIKNNYYLFSFLLSISLAKSLVASPLYSSTAHPLPPPYCYWDFKNRKWLSLGFIFTLHKSRNRRGHACCLTACPLSLLLIVIGILFEIILYSFQISHQPLALYSFTCLLLLPSLLSLVIVVFYKDLFFKEIGYFSSLNTYNYFSIF
jgi:hypothetical protein